MVEVYFTKYTIDDFLDNLAKVSKLKTSVRELKVRDDTARKTRASQSFSGERNPLLIFEGPPLTRL